MGVDASFHIYLLIGQSNMAGRGDPEPEDLVPHPRVLSLGPEGSWVPAVEPLHWDKPTAGVGPGLAFGRAIAERYPVARIGLIPSAAGGSPIRVWREGGHWEQTTNGHPYDDALVRARRAMQDGVLKGILWHQGESDSNSEGVPTYEARLLNLIGRLRVALGQPDLPFAAGTLGDFNVARNPQGAEINSVLRRLPTRIARAACVEAAGLGHKDDDTHFDSAGARELGRRYARAMMALL